MYRTVVLYLFNEGLESLLISEVVRIIEFGKGERVCKDLHILAVLALDWQFHKLIRILFMHFVRIGEPWPDI